MYFSQAYPTTRQANLGNTFFINVLETGPEGNNGFTYAPQGALGNIYVAISDGALPEPTSTTVIGLAMAGLLVRRRT